MYILWLMTNPLLLQLASLCQVYTQTLTSHLSPGPSPPSGVTAVQAGPTNITVSWSPATGYRIDYNSSGGYSGAVSVSGGSTDMETLTSLQNGDTYMISIVATSDANFPSGSVAIVVGLGKSLILCKDKVNLISFLHYKSSLQAHTCL